ncbi:MAG: hypothetical protein KDB58_06375 [Solirubrobacterales bacterium]|nr:hypothetical protein [Solirubrobacterales bacterium]MCB8970060.1 hypothetical protein [Thermoleophilales bacterium]MCO5326930.1 hypothetical protein [Solirubrobacterales bacterium]
MSAGGPSRLGEVTRLAAVAAAAVALLAPALAGAVKGNVRFGGDTDQGRKAKLVVDQQGRAQRGVWTVMTDCSGQYEDFRVRVQIRSPLDRATQDGFRDVGSTTDSDDTYSVRYRHEVEGHYTSRRKIKGKLSVEAVFRRNGKKYVTCTAEGLGFAVVRLEAS